MKPYSLDNIIVAIVVVVLFAVGAGLYLLR